MWSRVWEFALTPNTRLKTLDLRSDHADHKVGAHGLG
jgi:hypothetical protein